MNILPDFEMKNFYGSHVKITGVLHHCPIEHINCIKDDAIRSVEDINAEIIECLKEYL